MPDLDRPRLALYVALGLAVCVLGARYVAAQGGARAGDDAGAGRPAATAGGATRSPAGTGGGGAVPGDGSAAVGVLRSDGGRVTVHVAGAVRRPGLYRLAAGARIDDALRRAGGPRGRADLSAVNLAARLEDGRQILVPERPPAGGGAGGGAQAAGAAPRAPGAPPAPLNLNTATLEQLDALDGIGPAIAKRILDYREQHGGFGRVDELAEVPGIGPKRLAALTPLVTA